MTDLHLVTIGLDSYANEPSWTLPQAALCRDEIAALFVEHGAVVEDWTPYATLSRLPEQFLKWSQRNALGGDESEALDKSGCYVIYWVGHGEDTGYPDNAYWLALSDSSSPLSVGSAFEGSSLFKFLVNEQRRRAEDSEAWVLVILDTCGSGSGAWRIWSSFSPPELPRNLGVVATTDDGAAFGGRFHQSLSQVLAGFSGNDTNGVAVRELLRRLEDTMGENKVHHAFSPSAVVPVRVTETGPIVAPVDIHEELREVLAGRSPDLVNHFYSKAQGAELGQLAWHFKGRTSERRVIARWLEESQGGLFVVMGAAGAGKSALIGMVLASTDDVLMAALDRAGYVMSSGDLRPVDVTVDAVLHLSGLDVNQCMEDIGNALELPRTRNPDVLLKQVRRLAKQRERLTIIVDALDEARDPFTIAAGLLQRLSALPKVRILVGTRQSLGEDPDDPSPTAQNLVNVLNARPNNVLALTRDPDAMVEYATERLHRVLAQAEPRLLEAVAKRISEYDQPFLFARLAVHEIIAQPEWLDGQRDLQALLGYGHSGIFAHATRRFHHTLPKVEALLHVLAYGRGNGFPRTDGIWAIAAGALTTDTISDTDVELALREASPYILQDSEGGQAVYRLAHRSFAEHYLKVDGGN